MSDQEASTIKRTRTSTSRVKTGCGVCKVRRVKCDEGKPSCQRCRTAGRKCDGYTDNNLARSQVRIAGHHITVYVPPVQRSLSTSPGVQDLDFYKHKVAVNLSVYLDSTFWTSLVVQLSDSEPTIRHAVAAINASQRELEALPCVPAFGGIPSSPLIAHESSLAIRCLTARIQAFPSSYLVPLVACVLFTCLEFTRGSVDSAMKHMLSGFKILESMELAPPTPSDRETIETYVLPIFARLKVLCILFNQSLSPLQPATVGISFYFTTLAEARGVLYTILAPVLLFVRRVNIERVQNSPPNFEDYVEQIKLQHQHEQWAQGFEQLVSAMIRKGAPPLERAVDLLRIHHRTSLVLLSVALSSSEMVNDAFTELWEDIIYLGARLTAPNQLQSTIFSFEMQVIPSLYFAAIKCRLPSVRMRALDLLLRAPRREGLWNAHMCAQTAARLIEIEESGFVLPGGGPCVKIPLDGELVPCEEARVNILGDLPADFRDFQGFAPFSIPNLWVVTFQSRPWGPYGDTSIFTEDIPL